jgi:hypothetical protein
MPPNNNRYGVDPLLVDPEHGDYRLQPGSPAEGYGCQTFPPAGTVAIETDDVRPNPPAARTRQTIEASGPIQANTIWDADTIAVTGDVTIENGVTLTVRPGASVVFQGPYALTVMGRLLAVGTPEERICFTAGMAMSAEGGYRRADAWRGIRFPMTPSTNDSTRIEYCVIEFAHASAAGPFGGALYFDSFSKAAITNSILRDNEADYGGAVFCIRQASPRFAGTLIEGNAAEITASAVYSIDSYPVFTNCTITGNIDRNFEASWPTAAFVNFIAKPRTTACILYDNPSAYFLPTMMIEPKGFYASRDDAQFGLPGEGNIDLDPLFSGEPGCPYRLQADSPCRDAGGPRAQGTPGLDLAGSLRIVGTAIDMGSYEWIAPSHVGDGGAIASTEVRVLPNPARDGIAVRFALHTRARVVIDVSDLTGRKVRELADRSLEAGIHDVGWDGTDAEGLPVASGVYLVRLRMEGSRSMTAKVTIAR